MSDNEKEAGKRKRRRRGGLRVPSDNVPRAKSQSDVAAPAPEDPRLAVSVAYAFGSNGSGSAAAQLEDESAIRDTIRNPPVAEAPEDDDFPEQQTIELDSVDEVIEDSELGDDTEAAVPRPIAGGDSTAYEEVTRDLALDGEPAGGNGPAAVSGVIEQPAVGESVDIAFDEDELPEDETAPSADAPAGTEAEAEDEDEPEGEPAAEPPRSKRPSGARFIRAQTMALSDNDLEELMEGEVLDADAAFGFDQRATVRMEPLPQDGDDDQTEIAEVDVEPEPQLETAQISDDDLEDVPDDGVEPEAALEAVDELEPEDDASPLEPQDAGDSGEIIADDMLEELDELAQPVAIDSSADELDDSDSKTPPPAPPPAAVDKREVEPPPPPAIAKKPKPPPAPATAEPKPRRAAAGKAKPWFEEIFDENYLRTLPFLTPHATEFESDFVIESLDLDDGDSILDVGCGYGRHSMELAARGYNMVGLDLSLPLLLRGADEAQRRGLNINFVHGDMRDMTFETPFDGAYCLFATFGYFDDETNKQAAQQIAKALKPGARLVLEVLNRDYLIRDLPTRVWWEGDGCVILEEVDFNYFSSRVVSHRSIAFEDGRQLEQEISIRAFALHELGKLLHAAGFRVLEISGSMFTRGRFFGGQSRDIVVVAEKRGKNGAS